MKGILIVLLAISIVLAACSNAPKYTKESVDALAKCITANGGIEYGAFWCPKCAQVKKNFGSSFQYITYVECDAKGENEQSELCLQKGIAKYATFIFNDDPNKDNWLIGAPTFEALAIKSSCPMPVRVQ